MKIVVECPSCDFKGTNNDFNFTSDYDGLVYVQCRKCGRDDEISHSWEKPTQSSTPR